MDIVKILKDIAPYKYIMVNYMDYAKGKNREDVFEFIIVSTNMLVPFDNFKIYLAKDNPRKRRYHDQDWSINIHYSQSPIACKILELQMFA